jgi:DNA-binding response OmpR family regulator
MKPYTLLIASAHQGTRTFLASQLDADGHHIHEADNNVAAVAKLSTYGIDVMVLGGLERPSASPALLRAVRAGEHPRIHPAQPVITIGPDDELTTLRAYECGSDHHLAETTGYVLLRAVLASIARRALDDVTSRELHVGDIHIDLAARTVDVNGTPVHLSRLEFEVLVKFARDPVRVFSKHELARTVWGRNQISGRTVDSHVCRLRNRLGEAGAEGVLANRWGQGWALTTTG